MRITRLDVVDEWKLIRKFKKRLYSLHMNPIATIYVFTTRKDRVKIRSAHVVF